MALVDAGRLVALVTSIFEAAGCDKAEAGRIGHYLTEANLAGHDSHGVARVPRYVDWLAEGKVEAGKEVTAVVDTPSLAVLDGHYGFGQTVGPQAVRIGIAKAKAQGLAAVALRHAGHLGRIGDFAEMAAAEGLVSIHFVNVVGSILVAPHGGVDRRISTAPYCIGVPRPDGQSPLLLDFATSLVAEGKVLVASFGGKPIPGDALISPDGSKSNDPAVLYGPYPSGPGPRDPQAGPGAIRAFGDHKGSGLAFMCEILGGALTGAGATGPGKRFCNGMMSIYIDPKIVDPDGFFPAECADYVAYYKSSRPVEAGGEVLVPGETEARGKAKKLKDGVPLSDGTWDAIVDTAKRLGIGDNVIKATLLAS
ncbi:malate/lactate/ureidoglycolate dehydrogenase [Phreatobacter aquaticus]|uniref:Malate/lactate/ureidoglycolate dehydrogenase n=1 Tax=Phreatobacter aquaticus TaxID=2570229 RepID=A0A4D7QHS1_9HYPH|nr:malate/lactate/ureidoglycolate dehydrogenase [Phreatobacter aquaticus]QCK87300.1 malate/lactate/ureidoglycolate dehydrogenase [Phreatobacter aquaticus]